MSSVSDIKLIRTDTTLDLFVFVSLLVVERVQYNQHRNKEGSLHETSIAHPADEAGPPSPQARQKITNIYQQR